MVSIAAVLVFSLSALFAAAWYWLGLKQNRRRAGEVLRWLEFALATQGQPTGIRWISHSCFRVSLRMGCGVFHRAWVTVNLSTCEIPLRWLFSRTRGSRDLLTFQADLDLPPAFSLRVQNFRWCAYSNRNKTGKTATWATEECGRFVISSRLDWPREIPAAMVSLSRTNDQKFADIVFQRRSPHFSATLPLQAIAPGSPRRDCIFESMRDVAASASASLS